MILFLDHLFAFYALLIKVSVWLQCDLSKIKDLVSYLEMNCLIILFYIFDCVCFQIKRASCQRCQLCRKRQTFHLWKKSCAFLCINSKCGYEFIILKKKRFLRGWGCICVTVRGLLIFHYHWWTASIKLRLLFFYCRHCYLWAFPFISLIFINVCVPCNKFVEQTTSISLMGSEWNFAQVVYMKCRHLRIDSYFRAHMEYKRPGEGLKILWSASLLLLLFMTHQAKIVNN